MSFCSHYWRDPKLIICNYSFIVTETVKEKVANLYGILKAIQFSVPSNIWIRLLDGLVYLSKYNSRFATTE